MPHLRIEDPRSVNAAALSVALRQRLGISRPQLARWLGVTRQYISKLEGGMTPSKPVLYLMMKLDEESCQQEHPPASREGLHVGSAVPGHGPSVATPVNGGTGDITAHHARIPLLTMHEAADLTEIENVGVAAKQSLTFPAMDEHSFAVRIAGEAMSPRCMEGDVAIVYPSLEPRNGDLVFARPNDDKGGGLLLRLFHLTEDAETLLLTSYHAACPAVSLSRQDCQWLVPVVALVRQFR